MEAISTALRSTSAKRRPEMAAYFLSDIVCLCLPVTSGSGCLLYYRSRYGYLTWPHREKSSDRTTVHSPQGMVMRILKPTTNRALSLRAHEHLCGVVAALGRTSLVLMLSLAVAGLAGCGGSDEGTQAANPPRQGAAANNARPDRGRPTPPRQAQANDEAPKQVDEKKSDKDKPGAKRIVATPWNKKDVAEWTMVDYQNAITNKDVNYVKALEKRAAADSGDAQAVQELSQMLVLVAQMSDDGQNPDLFDSRARTPRYSPNLPRNRPRRSHRDDEDD